jgi:hypothetical protein
VKHIVLILNSPGCVDPRDPEWKKGYYKGYTNAGITKHIKGRKQYLKDLQCV